MSDTRAMRKIPMTAADQLEAARELGHELSVETGESRPDYADRDGGKRYRLACSCGWASNWRGSQRALTAKMVMHLGDVISDAMVEGDGVFRRR